MNSYGLCLDNSKFLHCTVTSFGISATIRQVKRLNGVPYAVFLLTVCSYSEPGCLLQSAISYFVPAYDQEKEKICSSSFFSHFVLEKKEGFIYNIFETVEKW